MHSDTQVTHMLPEDMQKSNEYYYARPHIQRWMQKWVEKDEDFIKIIDAAEPVVDQYREDNERLCDIVVQYRTRDILIKLLAQTCFCQFPETYVSVTAQIAAQFDAKEKQGMRLFASLLAIVEPYGAYKLYKPKGSQSVVVQSYAVLDKELLNATIREHYLPPMVCLPKTITKNDQSAYLTFNQRLMLGKTRKPRPDEDLCLDVINTLNRTPLSLSEEFLTKVRETPSFALNTRQKREMWRQFKQESREVYDLLLKQGNQFYLVYRPDTRGRLYAQGYHVTTQGTSYKKAMVELHEPELIRGVPDEYQTKSGETET